MECYYCKATLVRAKSPYNINRDGYHLVIDGVPAWLCKQCGEIFFEGQEVDAIQEIIRAVDSNIGRVQLAKV